MNTGTFNKDPGQAGSGKEQQPDLELLEAVLNNTASSIMLLKPVHNDKGVIVDFQYLFTNAQTLKSVQKETLAGKYFLQEFPGEKSSGLLRAYIEVMETGTGYRADVDIMPYGVPVWVQVYAQRMGEYLLVTYFDITEQKIKEQKIKEQARNLEAITAALYGRGHSPGEMVNVLADITERRRSEKTLRENEAWLSGQKEAFQAAMSGLPLAASLAALIRTVIEQTGTGARGAFYMIPAGGGVLQLLAGMPEAYARDIKGDGAGPEPMMCGLVVQNGEPVIIPDVEQDLTWQPWVLLARRHGYRGCCAFPVQTIYPAYSFCISTGRIIPHPGSWNWRVSWHMLPPLSFHAIRSWQRVRRPKIFCGKVNGT